MDAKRLLAGTTFFVCFVSESPGPGSLDSFQGSMFTTGPLSGAAALEAGNQT